MMMVDDVMYVLSWFKLCAWLSSLLPERNAVLGSESLPKHIQSQGLQHRPTHLSDACLTDFADNSPQE